MNEYQIYLSDTLDVFLNKEMLNAGYSDPGEYIIELLKNKRLKKLPQTLSKRIRNLSQRD